MLALPPCRSHTSKTCTSNPVPSIYTQDLTKLTFLHEPGVLAALRRRHADDSIYTYTGAILIAVNPFAPLPHLYGPPVMTQYAKAGDLTDLPPHVYAIATAAYRQMRESGKGQAILVTGALSVSCMHTSMLCSATCIVN